MVSDFWVAHGEVLLIDLIGSVCIGGDWLKVEGGWVEEDWCCCGAVFLSSMAVPGAKIAKFAVWIREEEADSRPDPAPGPADQLLHRPGRCHTRPDRAIDRPARPKPVPKPVPTGALVRKSLREPGSHLAPGPAETGQTGQYGVQTGMTGLQTG